MSISPTTALFLGFTGIGLLVGSISGLSVAELTTKLLALVVAITGGSVLALLKNLDEIGRTQAGLALAAFGFSATLGLYGGAVLRINGLLALDESAVTLSAARGVLRSDTVDFNEQCIRMARRGELETSEICSTQDPTAQER